MAAIQPKNTNDILVDSIGEKTGASGLTLVNDTTTLTGLFTNTITERTVGVGVDIESVNLQNGFVELSALTAPSDPISAGWRMYSDFFDTQLKARDNSGTVVNISGLPIKRTIVTAVGASTTSASFQVGLTTNVTFEPDELVIAIGEAEVSNTLVNAGVQCQTLIDGVAGQRHIYTASVSSSSGQKGFVIPFSFNTGLTGSKAIDLLFRQLNGGTAHLNVMRLNILQFKVRT